MKDKEIEKKINEVLDKIRPYLENDGGSVKFNRYENDVSYMIEQYLELYNSAEI